jgi:hypothetical protein
MPWFKVDDDLAFHRKVVAAGNAAMGLWVRAGSWSAQHLTDGFVPDHILTLIGTPPQRKKLIEVRLWIAVSGGIKFHEWNESGRQPTSKAVRIEREKAAERQRAWRAAKTGRYTENPGEPQVNDPGHGVSHSVSHGVSHGVTPPLVTPAPTRPDPTQIEETPPAPPPGGTRRRRRPALPIPADWRPNPAHQDQALALHLDLRYEAGQFRGHALSVDRRQADWDQAFRNWLDKSANDRNRRGGLRAVAGGSPEEGFWEQ